jgi:hypothetical protein
LDNGAQSGDGEKKNRAVERGSCGTKRITFSFLLPACFAVKLSECKPVKIQQEESWTVQRYCRRKNGIKKKTEDGYERRRIITELLDKRDSILNYMETKSKTAVMDPDTGEIISLNDLNKDRVKIDRD